ncbi:actin nucleation-promoting factor WASL isoform X2 [Pempheris klunzingeri]|uniref:actin nucleation-promoting factor WASL isoform X2 n=1 Tax=Pempheris klunzingeri TaxID=3127111 RepID=UPI0039816CCA
MSDLLTIREKGVLLTLLEPHCKLIKTTVAQVLEAKDTRGESPGWSCFGCGTMCLIEDESICSYFLRLYCVKRAKLLWEQELYIPFKYTATRTFFHTFPADGHQVGLNFANETEAEEFHLAVEAVQRNQEKMTTMTELANTQKEDSSTSDPPDSGIKPLDHLHGEQQFPLDGPATNSTPVTSSYLDPHMRKLLMQAKFSEKDLKDKDIAEAVDCIINQFGGLQAVQRELRNRVLWKFGRPSVSDVAESCCGVHLPRSEERTFAAGSLNQRQHHLPADIAGHRHARPESDSPFVSSSSSSCSSCSSYPGEDEKECKFQTRGLLKSWRKW